MSKKIYHWIDAKRQSHYSDHLSPGQIEVEDNNIANDASVVEYKQTTITQPLNQTKAISLESKINNQNAPFFNNTWVFFIIFLFFILRWLKKNKKENHKLISGRYKKNASFLVLTAESSLLSHKENEKTEKGLSGELTITRLFSSNLDKIEYKIVNGVTLKTFTGTTQIDHILISKYGIFVIETKNMSGWIHGSANQKKWTQTLSRTKEKFHFQNPVHQNYKHTKALQSLLKLDLKKFFPLVAFVGDSKFKTDMPKNVLIKDEVIGYIKKQQKILFKDNELIEIFNKIKSEQLNPSIKNYTDHIEHVKSITKRQTEKIL